MVKNIIFDLGGVLIDWNPEYLYRKIFQTPAAIDHFLKNICTYHWNECQDEGRLLADATFMLTQQFPQYRYEIEAYYGRWQEMLGGPIQPMVAILSDLAKMPHIRLFALTNWSSETFPYARHQYDFLQLFMDILVSGEEKLKKPDPAIFHLAIQRFQIEPQYTVFIDDNANNIATAFQLGFKTIHHIDVANTKSELNRFLV